MQFIRLTTSDADTRWINLAQVSRITIGEDAGSPFVAIVFSDGHTDDSLKICGTDDINRKAIQTIKDALNRLVQ